MPGVRIGKTRAWTAQQVWQLAMRAWTRRQAWTRRKVKPAVRARKKVVKPAVRARKKVVKPVVRVWTQLQVGV